jgi:hypothetical protein
MHMAEVWGSWFAIDAAIGYLGLCSAPAEALPDAGQ